MDESCGRRRGFGNERGRISSSVSASVLQINLQCFFVSIQSCRFQRFLVHMVPSVYGVIRSYQVQRAINYQSAGGAVSIVVQRRGNRHPDGLILVLRINTAVASEFDCSRRLYRPITYMVPWLISLLTVSLAVRLSGES